MRESRCPKGNIGTAMLFERRGRDRGASSAAAENAKDLWRARRVKATLSEKSRQGHLAFSENKYVRNSLILRLLGEGR